MDYQELRDWLDGEGGYTALLQHGVNVEEDIPEDLRVEWREMESAFYQFEMLKDMVNAKVKY